MPESAKTSLLSTIPALPVHVIRRDGSTIPFNESRIESAIIRTGRATGEFDGYSENMVENVSVRI